MSDVVSRIKNASGTVDAEIVNEDAADATRPFEDLSDRIDYSGSYLRVSKLDVQYILHEQTYLADSNGSADLIDNVAYNVAEFSATGLVGTTLVFRGLHSYSALAFAVVGSSGDILVRDSVTANDAVTPTMSVVTVPSGASKIYICYRSMSSMSVSSYFTENILGLYELDESVRYPVQGVMKHVVQKPDYLMYNTFVDYTEFEPSNIDERVVPFKYNAGYIVAAKHFDKGTTLYFDGYVQGNVCAFVRCNEDGSPYAYRYATDDEKNSDNKARITALIKLDRPTIMLWNYASDSDLMAIVDSEDFPPYCATMKRYLPDYEVPYEYLTGSMSQSPTWQSTEGYYTYETDTFKQYDGIKVSNPIAVSEGNSIYLSGDVVDDVPVAAFFDSNMNRLMCYPVNRINAIGEALHVEGPFIVPNDVAYMVLHDPSEYDDRSSAATARWYYGAVPSVSSGSGNVLAGKKLVTSGDSYTSATFSGSDNGKNYGYYIAERNAMSFVNDGISGSIMALDKTYVADKESVDIGTRSPFSYQRYMQVPEDTDYLIIWFGINDANHTNLGTIDDTTNETFYGAWNVVLRYYLENRPFMKILIVVTTGSTEAYRNAVRQVAKKWGYPVLDWEGDPEVPCFFGRESDIGLSPEARDLRRDAFGYNDYNAHPSPAFHEYESTIIENFLRSL